MKTYVTGQLKLNLGGLVSGLFVIQWVISLVVDMAGYDVLT